MTQRPDQTHPKRRRDAAATRSAIFEAATRRFACQGYQYAGVREIAADAGVDAAMVNRYFGSKEGLFAEVIERAFDIRYLV
jgi:AcrR family transcriptional regulator